MSTETTEDVLLSAAEVQRVSNGYRRAAEQLRELHKLGFYRARRNAITGEVILERAHYEAVCAGTEAAPARSKGREPQVRP